jgi:hypothetical protein
MHMYLFMVMYKYMCACVSVHEMSDIYIHTQVGEHYDDNDVKWNPKDVVDGCADLLRHVPADRAGARLLACICVCLDEYVGVYIYGYAREYACVYVYGYAREHVCGYAREHVWVHKFACLCVSR